MTNFTKSYALIRCSLACIVLLAIGLVGCVSIPFKWDPHDPELHGQEFKFTKQYVYYVLDRLPDKQGFHKEARKIGRLLVSQEFAEDENVSDRTFDSVEEGEVFTIQKSYRPGLKLSEEISGIPNYRRLVVTSSGKVSAVLVANYLIDTDRQDLALLVEKYNY